MKRGAFLAVVVAGSVSASVAAASLTASESAEVRGYVASDTHADRLRALVARPDLTSAESAEAMSAALAGEALDDRRMAFLVDVVQGGPTAASRPVLALATVKGLLARVEALYAQHPADLAQSHAVDEVARAYAFVAGEGSGADTGVPGGTRRDIANALRDHFAHEAGVLHFDVAVPGPVARLRAQAAVALLDALPSGPMRRVDAADAMGLTGARRAALVETGVLVADAAGNDARVAELRDLLAHFPGVPEGLEALFVGDAHATFRANGVVVSTDDAPPGLMADASSPWAPEAAPPAVQAATFTVARGLAEAVVRRAIDRRPTLRVPVEHEGLEAVASAAAMLVVDPRRTLLVAGVRSVAHKNDTLAALGDAIGALAAFPSAAAPASDGLAIDVGHSRIAHVSLEPSGVASAFHFEGHQWRVDRDPAGGVTALRRDGASVTPAMFPGARVAATAADSWKGEGLVLARLAGSPQAAITAGPRVRVVGTTVRDAVSSPAPGDDVAVDADLHVDGGPAGLVLRALPGTSGFKGASVLVLPGAPAHAVVVVGDGAGTDLAASPVVTVPAAATFHVHAVVRGDRVEATVAGVPLSASLPKDLAHGDVALRAYPGVTLEASGWRVARP